MPEANVGQTNDSVMLSKLPDLNPNNWPKSAFLLIVQPKIVGSDILKWGLATHLVTDQQQFEQIKEELIFNVRKDTTDEHIRQIIEKYAKPRDSNEKVTDLEKIE